MCMLIAMLMGMADCLPPDPRPMYDSLWDMYGPTPDCINRDRHVSYLTSLKPLPMRTGDRVTVEEYNHAIDLYVERIQWYCKDR